MDNNLFLAVGRVVGLVLAASADPTARGAGSLR